MTTEQADSYDMGQQQISQSGEKPQMGQSEDNEIRITGPGKTRNYIAYATGLLMQKGHESVELKAMGQAINKTVTIAEIIKRRIPGLHQNNKIMSISTQDTWEPLEEGLDSISVTRHVSVVCIVLSTVPLSDKEPGYQPPLPPEMVKVHISPSEYLQQLALAQDGAPADGQLQQQQRPQSSPHWVDSALHRATNRHTSSLTNDVYLPGASTPFGSSKIRSPGMHPDTSSALMWRQPASNKQSANAAYGNEFAGEYFSKLKKESLDNFISSSLPGVCPVFADSYVDGSYRHNSGYSGGSLPLASGPGSLYTSNEQHSSMSSMHMSPRVPLAFSSTNADNSNANDRLQRLH